MASALASPPDALAQGQTSSSQKSEHDFLVHRPRGAIGVRSGWQVARAGSDLFDFFEEQLTIERSDFDAVPLVVEVGIVVTPRLQVLAGFDLARTKIASEYRDWVDDDQQPIEQETSWERVSVSGSMKFALVPRGTQVSALAWVPRTVVPYVGAGGGAVRYSLSQAGDFVDFEDLGVFYDTYGSEGWAPMAQVFGGVDVRVWRMLFLTADARYQWAKADLDDDFVGFAPIDLSAFTASVGVSWVF
jgi:hypothetical protein